MAESVPIVFSLASDSDPFLNLGDLELLGYIRCIGGGSPAIGIYNYIRPYNWKLILHLFK